VTIEPHIDASPAVDSAGLKFGDRVVGDPADKYLEQQKLVIPSYRLGGFSDYSRLIHIVVDALDGVINVVGKFLRIDYIFLRTNVSLATNKS